MDRPTFVSTSYIKTTRERLWTALTDPGFTRRCWGATFQTDWKPGSTMRWEVGLTIADPEQVVLESDPFRRLAYTWHTFTREVADSLDLTEEARERIAAEPRSKVSFDLEPFGELVKLTVVHDGFDGGSLVASMIGQGWPRILSDLKTMLETGETLPTDDEPAVAVRLRLTTRAEQQAAGR